jgi:ComF family protein
MRSGPFFSFRPTPPCTRPPSLVHSAGVTSAIARAIKEIANGLADLILAPTCLGCEQLIMAGDSARLVCRRCRSRLKPLPSPACPRCGAPRLATGRSQGETCPECDHWPRHIRHARSAYLLIEPADRLVHQLKYRGWQALASPMAERMTQVDFPQDVAHAPRTCIPVPTTRQRQRERGYNQAGLLAEAYARRAGLEYREWLCRTGARGTQTTLQPAARAANVAGAFALLNDAHEDVRGAHILLVDDVLTTGATAAECADTLVAAGACCISILTFARALDARRLIQH